MTRLRSDRIPELDGLRGVAILLVIAFHYLEPFYRNSRGWRFAVLAPARMGWIGVDLFFVLSGYLIASILLANREASDFFSTFYVRRFCRILPLYVPVVAVLYFVHPLVSSMPQPPLHQFLTFTHNFWIASAGHFGNGLLAVTWSLAVEEQFYLLLPALVRFNRARRLIVIVIGCIGLAVLLRWFFLLAAGRDASMAILVLLPTRLDPLMLGVAAAWLSASGVRIPRAPLWIAWMFSGSWLAIAAADRPESSAIPHPFKAALFHLFVALFSVATLLIAIGGGFRFLRWKGLAYTGLISYGLYLLHQPALMFMRWLVPGLGAGLPLVAFIATFAAAAMSWEVYEKRFVQYGHRFLYDRQPPSAHASGAGMLHS